MRPTTRPSRVPDLATARAGRPRAALVRAGRALARGQDGAVAILFGLALIPVALIAGAALDYTRASDVRTYLAVAADSAALAAVTPAAMTMTAAQATQAATDLFNARVATLTTTTSVTPTVTVTDSGGQRTARVAFQADVRTTLMHVAGLNTITVGEVATAASSLPLYVDFHLLLDNTPSMGVGATPADVAKMVANTSDQCAFACHDLSAAGKDYYALAKKLGVTMRIDVVRSAAQQLMDTAAAKAAVPGQFRMAIHTFGATCGAAGLATVAAMSSNLTAAKASATGIDLMAVPYQNYNNDQCTDFDGNLAAMNALIDAPGDGSSSTRPQKVLFFVSDGVADAYYPSTCSQPTGGGRCQEPITVADCTTIKARGVKIAVLYTTYLPLPTNAWYNTWISPFTGTIGPRMAACASPDLYQEVSPTQGIAEAMSALFAKAVAQARLSS